MKKIFIGLGSYNEVDEKYFEIANEVSEFLISKNLNAVFGARTSGMMGIVYNNYNNSCLSLEAVTTAEYEKDLENLKCDKKLLGNTLNQIDYFLKSDILLFLPGGIGTLNEMVNAITAKRNNETKAKIIIFNFEGYYDKFFEFIEEIINKNFSIRENLYTIVSNLEELKKEI